MTNPLTVVAEILSDLVFFAGLAQPTPERLRRRARRLTKRARRVTRRGDPDLGATLFLDAADLRQDADKLSRGE